MSYRVQTLSFSGPFDLLLRLVSRQRVDIGAISVCEVADQYLAEVEQLDELDLDVASDFILVASTLLDIKAASLVPDADARAQTIGDDDEFDVDEGREVLIARLVAYTQHRRAAAELGKRMESEAHAHPRTAGPDPQFVKTLPDYLDATSPQELARICAELDGRRTELLLEAEHIAPRRLPVAIAMASVDRTIAARSHLTFAELVGGSRSPEQVVVTFLAVLQLFKLGSIRLHQEEQLGSIDIERIEGVPAFTPDDAAIAELEGEC